MRITLLGHAAILVEMAGATCLMDPIFFDPFEEGAVVSYPKRIVDPERLPRVDMLVVSHRHPDHFDLASLAHVPRHADVIVPADALIVYALRGPAAAANRDRAQPASGFRQGSEHYRIRPRARQRRHADAAMRGPSRFRPEYQNLLSMWLPGVFDLLGGDDEADHGEVHSQS
jgi:glyoxylase-like metal-dependent hydrolase (beta-lactamase superfamily II)